MNTTIRLGRKGNRKRPWKNGLQCNQGSKFHHFVTELHSNAYK